MALLASVGMVQSGLASPNGYTLSWSDEFNLGANKRASSANWGYNIGNSGWGNNELQTYTSATANSHIVTDANATDGLALQIRAIKKSANSYTSARLLSQGKVEPKYGFMEARIRIPHGQGIWPAYWMLGSNIDAVSWPACGEIDIMENVGHLPNTVWGTLHAPDYHPSQGYTLASPSVYHTDYHLFQASWTPNEITFYMDGKAYHSQNVNNAPNWPFNQPMFFILNVAVGGDWPGRPDASTTFPQNMLVDYVRVYRLTAPTSNEVVTLFSSANNKYVSAEDAGASPLTSTRTAADGWEKFLVVDLGGNVVAFQSQANGKFVTVSSGATPSLVANGAKVSKAAKFTWTANADGTSYLKSSANGRYLTVDTTKNPAVVVASAKTAGTAQAFGVTCFGQHASPGTPGVPTRFAAKAGKGSASLSWAKVSGASAYDVYATTAAGGFGMAPYASSSTPKLDATGLDAKKIYSFCVVARNSQGMSLRSQTVSIKPL